jgi:lipopolysaccharide heptosyltransferase I
MDDTAKISATASPRILIVRLSAIGDVIHGVPVLCALREALPSAFIGWVVEGRAGDVLEGHAALDELIRVPRRFWKSPIEIWKTRRRLKALKFDIAIDLQCLTKSALTAYVSGAPRRIGKSGEHGRELSRWIHNEFIEPGGAHIIEHYLSMLEAVGVQPPGVRFDLPEAATNAEAIDRFLRAIGFAGRRFAILNPGAGWPSKIWPAERYGDVAQYLFSTHGIRSIAVWGTAREVPLAEAIVASSDGAAMLAPSTTMLELAALCRRAALFVGSDTGPMHLSVAVGTPTISMHGPSRADWCGAYGPQNIRMQVRYEAGSAMERRRADDSAMRAITTQMVANACDQLLAVHAGRKCG